MELVDRFRYIMKLNQLSASAFAEKINVQRSSVSHVLSGRNKPSLEFIQKVLHNFPRVDANWLVNGSTKGAADKVVDGTDAKSTTGNTTEVPEPKEMGLTEGKLPTTKGENKIQRIVVYYSDKTFEEFTP